MSQNRTCVQCDRCVVDNHLLCEVCRGTLPHSGGNDNDPSGPGVSPAISDGPAVSLAPNAEPSHRAEPAAVVA